MIAFVWTKMGVESGETLAQIIYIGVSTTKFDQMIVDGRMPKPRRIDARRVWDIRALDQAFDSLPGGEDHIERNPWDDILAASNDALEPPRNMSRRLCLKSTHQENGKKKFARARLEKERWQDSAHITALATRN